MLTPERKAEIKAALATSTGVNYCKVAMDVAPELLKEIEELEEVKETAEEHTTHLMVKLAEAENAFKRIQEEYECLKRRYDYLEKDAQRMSRKLDSWTMNGDDD